MAVGAQIGSITGTIKIDYDGSGIARADQDVNKLKKSGLSTGDALKKTSTGLLTFGGVIAAGFGVAANTAISFEKRMSAVAAVSGATADEMDKLSAKALQLGKDTAFSASDAGLAMEELVKAGLSVQDVLNGAADATVALAAAGEVELPEAATIASNAMNQFGLSAQQLPGVADTIAGAANASAIDVREFGFSLAQVGAVAHLAGQTFDDTATAIALMGNAGIKGSDAGTSLKTFLSRLIPTTEKASGAMEELGIITKDGANQFIDAQGNFKSLGDIAEILHKSLDGLSEGQKQVALETLFGSDAIRAAAIIAGEGKKGFDDLNAAMHNTTAAEVAAKRLDNTAGSIEQLKGSAETLGIQIGTILIPALRDIIDGLTKATNWFSNLDDGTKKTIVSILGILGGLALLGGALIKIVTFGQRLWEVLKVLKLVSLATKIWTGVQWLLNIALNANPIGLIIIAVAALVAGIILLWKNSAAFRDFFIGLWDHIWSFLKMIGAWFAGPFADFFVGLWDGIVKGAKGVWDWLVMIWNGIVDAVKFAVDLLIAYVQMIIDGWNKIIDFFVMLWNFVVNSFKTAVAKILSIVGGIVAIVAKVRGFFDQMRQAAVDKAIALVNFLKGIPGKLLNALGNVGKMLFNAGRSIIQGLIDGLKSMFSNLWNTMTDGLKGLRDLLPFSPAKKGPFSGKGWTLFSGMAMVEDLAKGISKGAEFPVDAMTATLAGVTASLSPVASAATTATPSAPGAPTNIGSVHVQGVWDFTDPVSTRKMVGTLDDELDKYRKGYQ